MFALLRNVSIHSRSSAAVLSCSAGAVRNGARRYVSASAVRRAEIVEDTVETDDGHIPDNPEELLTGFGSADAPEDGGSFKDPTYEEWLETEGRKFKEPRRPRNWLGGEVPFPLNPSFKPPTPLSDAVKTLIYELYMANPEFNSVRSLAERYGLSIKRVDAILRLKGLEAHWKEGKELQTGFQVGMEEILGVKESSRNRTLSTTDGLGEDATKADLQAESPENAAARDRYQRMFWEPTIEGREPVVAQALEAARAYAQKHKQMDEAKKNDPVLLGIPSSESLTASGDKVRIVTRPNRPAMKFVDVGGKFLDVKDRVRRMKESERRSRIKAKRREIEEIADGQEQEAST